MGRSVSNEDIREYYQECHSVLDEGWLQNDHRAIHVGYFVTGEESHEEAIEALTRKTATVADVRPGDHVLDAGCGVGGPAVWLAENCDAEVTGINITDDQLAVARNLADRRSVADRTSFRNDDLTEMRTIPDNSVDVVWSIEAVCYAADKRDFLEQAKRVLTDGGRLAVVDGYLTQTSLEASQRRSLNRWLDGWSLPNVAHVTEFTSEIAALGFTDIETRDITENVQRSSRLMYYKGLLFPVAEALYRAGVWSETKRDHYLGCYHQRSLFNDGVCGFYIISAQL